jgi:DNA mismatch repair protein MutL
MKEKTFFFHQGIELAQIGQNQIAIKTSPPQIQNKDLTDIVLQALNFIEENEQLEEELFRKKLNEHVHSHMACKMAVKAGDELSQLMLQKIVLDLQKTQNRFICVHGRPTTWTISKEELEKNFRRR